MSIPEVTCGADVELLYDGSPRTVGLTATATNSPTSWRWDILSVPTGSTANVGTKGDFTDGVATVQNPDLDIDGAIDGTYVLQCVATNATGSSNPDADKDGGQQQIVVKTQDLELTLPGEYSWKWGLNLLDVVLRALETAITSGPTPGTHASSHQSGGPDAIKLDNLAAPDDNTDLNSSTGAHGLCPKLSGNSSEALRGDGTWGAVTGAQEDTKYFSYFYQSGSSWDAGSNFSTGLRLWFLQPGVVNGIQFYCVTAAAITFRGKLWNSTTELASGTVVTSGVGVYQVTFSAAYTITTAMLGDVDFYLSLYDTTTPGGLTWNTGDPPGGPLLKIGTGWVAYDGIPHHYLSGGDSSPPTSTAGVGRYPIDPIFELS